VPVVLRSGPYTIFFYSADYAEPPHVHVRRDQSRAKVWLDPVTIAWAKGFTAQEIRRIVRTVRRERDRLLGSWNEHFRG